MPIVGLLVAILFAFVATAEPVEVAERVPTIGWGVDVQPPVDEPQGFVPNEPAPIAPAEGIDVADARATLTAWLEIIAFVAIALAAAFAARQVVQRRDDQRGDQAGRGDRFRTLAEVADAIVADAEAHRAALRDGSPRNAIVECWLALEASVETAGVEYDPALTSSELTSTVLQRFPVDAAAVERLGALYREARFSTHELAEPERLAALDALDAVHAGLRRAARTRPTAVAT